MHFSELRESVTPRSAPSKSIPRILSSVRAQMETNHSSARFATAQCMLMCAGEALAALFISALVRSHLLAQDSTLNNKAGVKGENHVQGHSMPYDAESDAGSEDGGDDDDEEDGGFGEGEEDLSSEEGEGHGNNPNGNKSNPKKDPLDGTGRDEENVEEEDDDEDGGDNEDDEDEDDEDDDDDGDDDDGGEDDEEDEHEEEDEEEEALQPPKKRKK